MRTQPNVIIVITDDQGYGDIGYHGNPWLHTPQLDRMARQSVQLDNHHHDPLCSPSRAALLTGQYACRNGVWHVIQGRHLLHPKARTLAEIFSANGYRTGMFGKWHLGDNYPFAPQFRGFDEVLCHRGGGVGELPDYWGNNYVDDSYFRNGEAERCSGYCTDVFFSAALEYMEANHASPFLIYLATNAMHAPHIVPEAYASPYLAQGLPEERARFYGMIANFDANMGRLFDKLRELQLDEDTIVIFTSDHGSAAGFNPATGEGYNAGLRGAKGDVYDGGHQVNFFLRWPNRLLAGYALQDLTAHIDILPTLADLCGLHCPADLEFDGCNLAPLMRGEEAAAPERSVIIQLQTDRPRKWHHTALLNGPWRLINGAELYDVSRDRGQADDVAARHLSVVAALRREYDAWWESMEEAFAQTIAIPVGIARENPALLSARDWHPTVGRVPWMQRWIAEPAYDANGYWFIEVVQAGRYVIDLRSYPREARIPIGAVRASLWIGESEFLRSVEPSEYGVEFQLDLPAGIYKLRTRLDYAGGERSRGAYYVYVTHCHN